jgi:voltage-dependent potassium channel beta subunit
MEYRRIGKTGIKISEIALGAWLTYGRSVDEKLAERIVKTAVERGVNFVDLADVYAHGEAEKTVGRAIKDIKRSDLVISSKVFWPMSDNVNDRGLSRKHIMMSIENTLKRIGTDYLDLYFCHRADPETEIEETVRAMEDVIRQGKVLYWGTSVWESAQIEEAVAQAYKWRAYPPVVEQPRYNMFDRHIEKDIVGTCRDHGMGLTVWSPLAQGLLTGKYNDGIPKGSRGDTTEWLKGDLTQENLDKVAKLADLAKSLDITISQLALAWILRLPEISCAITGATKVEHLEENVGASGVTLDDETLTKIERILGNTPQ